METPEQSLDSAEVSISTVPIPSTHDSAEGAKSNSSSNSSGTGSGNSSTLQITLTMAELHIDYDNDSEEEMPDKSDDDSYDRNGGYNEYGERDKGYYYRDRRYKRKVLLMMSPIISPVSACC